MYKMILVPLDGSELSEMVLPHVEMLAQATKKPAEVVLLRVAMSPSPAFSGYQDLSGQGPVLAEKAAAADKEEAEKYLAEVGKRLRDKGLRVRVELLVGSPGDEILDYAENNPVDLIAMASHGRSGISRWAYGSVTSKVLRGISTPILVVTPPRKK
ncbi:MAG: universal stress protein [Chloroflexota bacterium]|nr:universal stress protein [Chloroflexota bacterium]